MAEMMIGGALITLAVFLGLVADCLLYKAKRGLY